MKKLSIFGLTFFILAGCSRTPLSFHETENMPFGGWKTYRDDTLGVEFKYPKDFHFDAEDSYDGRVVLRGRKDENTSKGPSIWIERKYETLNDYFNLNNDPDKSILIITENGKIQGRSYAKGHYIGIGEPDFIAIEHPQNGLITEISVVFDSGELNGIISTLKFIGDMEFSSQYCSVISSDEDIFQGERDDITDDEIKQFAKFINPKYAKIYTLPDGGWNHGSFTIIALASQHECGAAHLARFIGVQDRDIYSVYSEKLGWDFGYDHKFQIGNASFVNFKLAWGDQKSSGFVPQGSIPEEIRNQLLELGATCQQYPEVANKQCSIWGFKSISLKEFLDFFIEIPEEDLPYLWDTGD